MLLVLPPLENSGVDFAFGQNGGHATHLQGLVEVLFSPMGVTFKGKSGTFRTNQDQI